ncbi:MAG: SCO family protein [Planctomycetota bacterium]
MSHPSNGTPLSLGQKAAWALLVIAVAALVGFAFWKKTRTVDIDLSGNSSIVMPSKSDAPRPEDLAVLGRVSDFKFTDQDGKTVEAKDLLGDVWVATFIFTHCAGTCPVITLQLANLDKEIKDLPNVKLISFSMDPDNDTPEVLKKYIQKQEAVSPRWKFLTGPKSEMFRITRDDFKLVVKEQPDSKDDPIIHSSKIVVVDAQGYIRARFDGIGNDGPSPEAIKLLAASIRKLRTLPPVSGKEIK